MRIYPLALCALLLWSLSACTLTSAPPTDPTELAQIGTGQAPPEALTPNALRTPADAATPTPDSTCRAVNEIVLAVRVSADINAQEVVILGANSTSVIVGRTGNNTWWQVRTPNGAQGWVDASAVTEYGDCLSIPVLNAATVTPAATATPNVPMVRFKVNLNVRSGPSTRFAPPLGQFGAGTETQILAVNFTRDWYKVRYNGRDGWVSADTQYVEVAGNVNGLPSEAGPPTPTATNTPIPSTPTPTLDPSINYLQDPSFEGDYTGRGSPDFNIPAAWLATYYEAPRDYEWQNLRPVAFPHITPPEVRNGARALNLSKDYATFTAVVYQQASVPANISVTAGAWAWIHTCDPAPAICSSDPASNARVRVGIDPTGGTNPFAGSVVWSGFIAPHDSWGYVGVSSVAQGGTVTVFLYGTQDTPRGLNRLYWDDAVLNVGG